MRHSPKYLGSEVVEMNWKNMTIQVEMDTLEIGIISTTFPETNIAPENGWLEDCFPFRMAYTVQLSIPV